jgi:hypothetical protein
MDELTGKNKVSKKFRILFVSLTCKIVLNIKERRRYIIFMMVSCHN